jgi:hypothetical protein
MFGITYMQQISETSSGVGLHIEPGIWAKVPPTSNPHEPQTVVRMASIPHGTVILAQGTTEFINGGPPNIPANNIIPFGIGSPPPPNSEFGNAEQAFPELNLSHPTPFRHASPGVTQAMVKNPNSVLEAAIQGKPMTNRTFIHISTTHHPVGPGGGSQHRIPRGYPECGEQRPGGGGGGEVLDRDASRKRPSAPVLAAGPA